MAKCKKGYVKEGNKCVKRGEAKTVVYNRPIVIPSGSFVTLLTLLFIALKLTGYISWSWWWILSPLWISFGLGILLVIIAFLIGGWLMRHD